MGVGVGQSEGLPPAPVVEVEGGGGNEGGEEEGGEEEPPFTRLSNQTTVGTSEGGGGDRPSEEGTEGIEEGVEGEVKGAVEGLVVAKAEEGAGGGFNCPISRLRASLIVRGSSLI